MTESVEVELSKAEFAPLYEPIQGALDDVVNYLKVLPTFD
jgi:hypothetical protein